MGRQRSRATLDGHRGCLRDAPLHTGLCSAARPPAAVSPLVRTRPARGNRARGQYAYCTSRCTRRTRAATPGHGTPHRREEAATDGSAEPSLMRAACTSATARTAHQGRLLPHHGDAAARSGTAHRQAPRAAPSLAGAPPLQPSCLRSEDAPTRPTATPARAARTCTNRGPCRRRTTAPCPPPAPPCSATDRQPQQPGGGPMRPRGPRTARQRRVHCDCASLSRGHGALRGEAPGADGHARLARRAPPSQARRGRQRPAPHAVPVCLATTLLRWRPASLPSPCRGTPPVPDRDTPLQNGRDGRPGHAGPHPGTWRCVCIVCYSLVYVPSELTRRRPDPRPPWPPTSALRQAPPAPRHALMPGEAPLAAPPPQRPAGTGARAPWAGPSPPPGGR